MWGAADDEGGSDGVAAVAFADIVIPIALADGAAAPEFKSAAAAGMDLCALEGIQLEYGIPTKIDTGVSMALPFLLYGQIAGRSSMAAKGIATFPGVIDSDYRGSIKVLLTNQSPDKGCTPLRRASASRSSSCCLWRAPCSTWSPSSRRQRAARAASVPRMHRSACE